MATITGFQGKQWVAGTKDYDEYDYSYSYSTYGDKRLHPALIIQPNSVDDIVTAVKYAKKANIAIAVRTGGHQYSGASSTYAPNIQLDLKHTFKTDADRQMFEKDGRSLVRTSVSWSLLEFNDWLGSKSCFVPHGQCIGVHLGGHVQTGGYGQLGRSFGLLGDHVLSLEIVDHNGDVKEITKQNAPEMFFAILGGSPGNLGVLTHFTVEVHNDGDYGGFSKEQGGPRGLKAIHLYHPDTVKRLLKILVEMSDNPDYPRNYDLCISVLSSDFPILKWFKHSNRDAIDHHFREDHPEIYGEDDRPLWPRTIVVFAQWVPLGPDDVCDMSWFEKLNHGALWGEVEENVMSKMTSKWLFRAEREFELPYIKRTYFTKSNTLGKDGWVDWVTARVDEIIDPVFNNCWLSCQFQCFGGKNSKFTTNADNGTAYSWRDSSMCATTDCFYAEEARQTAADWQYINDHQGVGQDGIFSKQDRRVLWGSWGDFDFDKVWSCYHEDREKYERVMEVRKKADPDGVFTPNSFCVKRADREIRTQL
ncbi:hypothetical protein LTR37_003140 [Vermiconidia calcicola]|uniref:Uncharacterized protein n=1 Tax=Vermiconidia calcicola TaxID=1690605 RepID=A0ACC3NTW9_9PEZI|nr:hypothetical protein LTR37_003140 [Vermiconidia calcicola]